MKQGGWKSNFHLSRRGGTINAVSALDASGLRS
jgi:hypothetical protein